VFYDPSDAWEQESRLDATPSLSPQM
jgi:hypothetical protein